ncbi:MAG: hypothetical protein IPM47_17725 [Sphingobacteriales bacterium]|nr:MAG: hypothetical protein IPM47_17725 [Sphingobacteriales bacterium]
MKKKITFIYLAISISVISNAQYNQEWFSIYVKPTAILQPEAVKLMAAGDHLYLLAKIQGAVMNDEDMALVKFDSDGKIVWEKNYTVPGNFNDDPIDMDIDNSGNVYVVIASAGEGLSTAVDFCTIKYAQDGTQNWIQRWGTREHGEIPCGIEVRNGMVFVSGKSVHTAGQSTAEDYHSKIYNANTGKEVWSHSWNGPGDDWRNYTTDMTLDNENNLVVVGSSEQPGYDYGIIRYKWDTIPPKNPADSLKIELVFDWERWYNGPGNHIDEAQFVVTNLYGDIYVTGNAFSNEGKQDIVTIKYDSKGTQKWVRTMNGTANTRDEPIGIGLDSKGNVIVTGYVNNIKTKEDYCIIKYNAYGDTLWTTAWWEMVPGKTVPSAMVIDQEDHILVAGVGPTLGEPYARRLDPDGKIVWETIIKSPEGKPMPGGLHKICIDEKGNLYLSGLYINQQGMNLFVTKYSKN